MIDPFEDFAPPLEEAGGSTAEKVKFEGGQPRILLPVSLASLTFIGAVSPWIVLRPLGKESSRYNLTDIPGGMGILLTLVFLALLGTVIMVWRRRTGLVILSLVTAILGWMAAVSGLLLGTLSSLIPAVEVAGIDLRRAQLGQGSGVVVTAFSSLILAFLCVRHFDPVSRYSPAFNLPVVQIAALAPLIVVTNSIHQGWVVLGNPDAEWNAVVPGDSLYGSGLLVIALWLGVGFWMTSIVLRRPIVTRIAGISSILLSAALFMYVLFVWLGGKALNWLTPSSIEGWANVSAQPGLYLTAACTFSMFIFGVVSLFFSGNEKSIQLSSSTSIGTISIPTSDLAAYILWFFVAVVMAYTRLT